MAKRKTSKKKKVGKTAKRAVSQEKIREKAYFNYLNRGCTDGRHLEDWYNAEKEMKK